LRVRARVAQRILNAGGDHLAEHHARRTSPATKASLRGLYATYRDAALASRELPSVWETGFRVFSQFDEDGVLLFLLAVAGTEKSTFVDIGAGDGVAASNCANLALNLGFDGLFVEADAERVSAGERFYRLHRDTSLFPPAFRQAFVTRANVNDVIRDAGFEGDVDVLSIDIDGNDYWIWEALDVITPRIVIIETQVERGLEEWVAPYDETFRWSDGAEGGASLTAMDALARRLGYRLVGANRFGFNIFFVRSDVATALPELAPADLLRHRRNRVSDEARSDHAPGR
jgi:hypothetical protein